MGQKGNELLQTHEGLDLQVSPSSIHPKIRPDRQYKRPGRPKTLFRYDFDKHTGLSGYFMGYCDDCGRKQLLPLSLVNDVRSSLANQRKSWHYRLLMRMLRKYEHDMYNK